jgi:hypothetical protein
MASLASPSTSEVADLKEKLLVLKQKINGTRVIVPPITTQTQNKAEFAATKSEVLELFANNQHRRSKVKELFSSDAPVANDSTANEPRGEPNVAGKSTNRGTSEDIKKVRGDIKIQNDSKITQEQIESKLGFIQVGWNIEGNNGFDYDYWYDNMQRYIFSTLRPNVGGFDNCFHAPDCTHQQDLYEIALEIKSQIETDGKLSGSLAQVEDVLAGSNNVQNWSEKYLAHRELLKKAGWTVV